MRKEYEKQQKRKKKIPIKKTKGECIARIISCDRIKGYLVGEWASLVMTSAIDIQKTTITLL